MPNNRICSWNRHKELQHAEKWTTITERNPFFSSPLSVPFIRCCSIFRSFVLIWCLVCFRSFSVYGTGSGLLLSSVCFSRVLFFVGSFSIFKCFRWYFFPDSLLAYCLLALKHTRTTLFSFIRSHCALLCHIYLCWLFLWNWSYLIFTAFRLPLLTSQMKYCFP